MADYNLAELKGAVRVLEALVEVADEENAETIPVTDIRILLTKYRSKLNTRERFS